MLWSKGPKLKQGEHRWVRRFAWFPTEVYLDAQRTVVGTIWLEEFHQQQVAALMRAGNISWVPLWDESFHKDVSVEDIR